MSMSAHDALTTLDCVQPGCVSEAAKGSEFCDVHRPSRLEAERRARLDRMFGAGSRAGSDSPADPERKSPSMPVPAAISVLTGTPPIAPPATAEPKAAPPTQETPIMALATCKIDGCDNPSAGRGGSWVGLCVEHITAKQKLHAAATAYVDELRDRYGIAVDRDLQEHS